MVQLKTVAGVKSPVEISAADTLATLRQRAEDSLGDELVGAVITVPAYFDDAQRQATKDAAQLAGLNVLRLLSEPTAAAIAYGLDHGSEGVYAVYDLGGGTFDISILKLSKGVFEVLSTGGDSALGGDDFDHRLFCWICEQAKLAPLSDEDTATLMVKSRARPRNCCRPTPTPPSTPCSTPARSASSGVTPKSSTDITKHLVDKTMTAIKKAHARRVRVGVDDVDGVVMVGGATRMPHVQRAVTEFFKTIPHANIDPDKVVALGAAIQANLLAGNRAAGRRLAAARRDPALARHRNHGRPGRENHSAQFDHPLRRARRSSPPSRMARPRWRCTCCRASVNWCRTAVRWRASSCAAFRRWWPAPRASASRTRSMPTACCRCRRAKLRSGVEASITVKPSYGLADDEVARMLQDSYKSARWRHGGPARAARRAGRGRAHFAGHAIALDGDAALLDERVANAPRIDTRC